MAVIRCHSADQTEHTTQRIQRHTQIADIFDRPVPRVFIETNNPVDQPGRSSPLT